MRHALCIIASHYDKLYLVYVLTPCAYCWCCLCVSIDLVGDAAFCAYQCLTYSLVFCFLFFVFCFLFLFFLFCFLFCFCFVFLFCFFILFFVLHSAACEKLCVCVCCMCVIGAICVSAYLHRLLILLFVFFVFCFCFFAVLPAKRKLMSLSIWSSSRKRNVCGSICVWIIYFCLFFFCIFLLSCYLFPKPMKWDPS